MRRGQMKKDFTCLSKYTYDNTSNPYIDQITVRVEMATQYWDVDQVIVQIYEESEENDETEDTVVVLIY